MSNRLYDFPQNYKGEGKLFKFVDWVSGIMLMISVLVWIFLYSILGEIIPMAVHVIGIILVFFPFAVYTIKIPAEYYNKLGGERLYKLLYSSYLHKKNKKIYVAPGGKKW